MSRGGRKTRRWPPEPNPRLVFERLFGGGPRGQRQEAYRVRQQTQQVDPRFCRWRMRGRCNGSWATRKNGSWTSILRAFARLKSGSSMPRVLARCPTRTSTRRRAYPSEVGEHMDLMYDLLGAGVPDRFDADRDDDARPRRRQPAVSAARRRPTGITTFRIIRRSRTSWIKLAGSTSTTYQHFARFLEKLDAARDVDGRSLLDNSMIVYAGGNADRQSPHSHTICR